MEIIPAGCFFKKQDSPIRSASQPRPERSPRPKGVGSTAEAFKMVALSEGSNYSRSFRGAEGAEHLKRREIPDAPQFIVQGSMERNPFASSDGTLTSSIIEISRSPFHGSLEMTFISTESLLPLLLRGAVRATGQSHQNKCGECFAHNDMFEYLYGNKISLQSRRLRWQKGSDTSV